MEYHLVTKEILLILENYTLTYAKLKGLEISGLRQNFINEIKQETRSVVSDFKRFHSEICEL